MLSAQHALRALAVALGAVRAEARSQMRGAVRAVAKSRIYAEQLEQKRDLASTLISLLRYLTYINMLFQYVVDSQHIDQHTTYRDMLINMWFNMSY